MAAAESDSSLLFGILALQNGLIEQPDLIAAFQCWCKDRSRSIAQVLIERGRSTESDRAMLDGLIERHAAKQRSSVDGAAAGERGARRLDRRLLSRISAGPPRLRRRCGPLVLSSKAIHPPSVISRSAWGPRSGPQMPWSRAPGWAR